MRRTDTVPPDSSIFPAWRAALQISLSAVYGPYPHTRPVAPLAAGQAQVYASMPDGITSHCGKVVSTATENT